MVEQRTENPRVGGSIPSLTTNKKMLPSREYFFIYTQGLKRRHDVEAAEEKQTSFNACLLTQGDVPRRTRKRQRTAVSRWERVTDDEIYNLKKL